MDSVLIAASKNADLERLLIVCHIEYKLLKYFYNRNARNHFRSYLSNVNLLSISKSIFFSPNRFFPLMGQGRFHTFCVRDGKCTKINPIHWRVK